MTTTTANRNQVGLVADGGELTGTGLAARLRRAWSDRRAYQATRSELAALTDRELRDLGVRREDISAIAREAAYGK